MSKARIVVTVESTTRLMYFDHTTVRTVDEFKDYIHRELGLTSSVGKLYLLLSASRKVELTDADLPCLETNDEIFWSAAKQQQMSQRPTQQCSSAQENSLSSSSTERTTADSETTSTVASTERMTAGSKTTDTAASTAPEPPANSKAAATIATREPTATSTGATWEDMFLLLKDYKMKHGHCNVPTNSGKLGSWVNNQRIKYRKMKEKNDRTLSNEQIDKLESIGFEWKLIKSSRKSMASYNIQFNTMKDKFVAYKKETGTGWVPRWYKQDPQLATWAKHQRRLFNTDHLKKNRRKVLDDVGFEWKRPTHSKQRTSIKSKQPAQDAVPLSTDDPDQSNIDCTSPLPTNQFWAFDLPDDRKVIYNSKSLSTLPEGILKSMTISSLGKEEDVQFLLSLKKKATESKVTGGPDYTLVKGDFHELFGFPKAKTKKQLHTSVKSLQKLIVESISRSGKWTSEGRTISDASSMVTNTGGPQDCHSDWQQENSSIDERDYPLSILIPVTKAGSYVQVWDPEEKGHAYVLHIRFGELVMFDPRCLHGGNIGGHGDYPRLHCFAVTDTKHSTPGGPYWHDEGCHHSLQNPQLTPEQKKELCDSICRELSLEEGTQIQHKHLDEYLQKKDEIVPGNPNLEVKRFLVYKATK